MERIIPLYMQAGMMRRKPLPHSLNEDSARGDNLFHLEYWVPVTIEQLTKITRKSLN
jgi:hypothetical protein